MVSCDRFPVTPQFNFASALLACNHHGLRFAGQTGDKTAEARRQGCLAPSIRKNRVAHIPAKANALLNRYEELPQYDKGTLDRSIEQQIARYERHCAAKRERSAMRWKAFAKMKPVNAGDAPDTDSISSSSSRLAR